MADYCVLPVANLCEIPPETATARAIFVEPLSAACEILEQLTIDKTSRAVVLGDGRIGILCAWVLSTRLPDVTLIGHHPEKLALAQWRHVKTKPDTARLGFQADIVVDATGSENGIHDAISLCRPRGTVVLKTTVASQGEVDLTPIVVHELTLVGSRCGQFKDGLRMLSSYPDMPVERLITDRYRIDQAKEAFDRSSQPDAIKVLIEISGQ
jgi:alcohol dehydrogenase